MIRILISRQTGYPANTKELKKRVRTLLEKHGAVDCEVSIALVGERKVKELSKALGEENGEVHEVLSFPSADPRRPDEFAIAEEAVLPLGDIVICYPAARRIAMKKNKLVDEVLGQLAEHGTLHLLGIHHEE